MRIKTKDHRFCEARDTAWIQCVALLLWLTAAVLVFIPFARDTSAWDAVRLHVPGNQGNWWHALVGAPFFLAYPMVWLRMRLLFSNQGPTSFGRRAIWSIAGLSIVGTIAVETPFLLHLAGTGEWQRLWILSVGFGIILPAQQSLSDAETASPPRRLVSSRLKRRILQTRRCVLSSTAKRPATSGQGWAGSSRW